MITRYGRGDWWAAATPGSLLVLPPSCTGSSHDRARAALLAGADLAQLVEVLSDDGGLLDLPSFACMVHAEGRPRLLLRGLRADVDGAEIDARDVLTWVETGLTATSTARLRLEDGADLEHGLLVRDGVVRCGSVCIEVHPAAERVLEARPDHLDGEERGEDPAAELPPTLPLARTESTAAAPSVEQTAPTAVPTLPLLSDGGALILPDGVLQPLDAPVVIGRGPATGGLAAAARARFVVVASPTKDISRRHVEIRREGDTAVVVDLATSNGTTLLRTGRPPFRLIAKTAQVLLDQDVIDLGDDVRIRYVAAVEQG